MIFRFGEFFSGPGGMAAGAMRASVLSADGTKWGANPCWAVDSDPDSCLTYRLNIHRGDPEAQVICSDVRKVDVDALGEIDAFLFGFPCNDFSEAGKRRGLNGSFGPLYLEGVRAIEAKKPSWFVAENVSGLQQANEKHALKQIVQDLAKAGDGYTVVPHLYRFEEYGVPQQRRRIVIVGVRADHAENGVRFRPPAPSGRLVSAREALELPMPGETMNAEAYSASREVLERLKAIRPGENIWEAQRRPDFPDACRLHVKGKHLSLIYKRLDPDRPAYTILSNGGGGTVGYHWDEARPLTNRERARLQTFPDDYGFLGAPNSVRSQIGMAVPPVAAERIVTAVLSSFAGLHYESVEQNIDLGQSARRNTFRRTPMATELMFECSPSPKNSARRTDLVRALLATRLAQGASRSDIFKETSEFIPGIKRKDVSNMILRLRELNEIEEADGVIKLTADVLNALTKRPAQNPFLNGSAAAGNEPRPRSGKTQRRKAGDQTSDTAARSETGPKQASSVLAESLLEALNLASRGLGMLRSALYDSQSKIDELLGADQAAVLSDGVMEADQRLEQATRRLRSLVRGKGPVKSA